MKKGTSKQARYEKRIYWRNKKIRAMTGLSDRQIEDAIRAYHVFIYDEIIDGNAVHIAKIGTLALTVRVSSHDTARGYASLSSRQLFKEKLFEG